MKNTKTKLISSVAVLLICFAMLIGSTFAWFTDSASTGVNKIQAGNLDIEAYYQNGVPTAQGTEDYTVQNFNRNGGVMSFETTANQLEGANVIDERLWEPGKVGTKLITVENKGSLSTIISLNINVNDNGLESAMWYDFISVGGSQQGAFTERRMNSSTEGIEVLASHYTAELRPTEKVSFILVYGMYEEAGNEYQDKSLEAYVTVLAKQAPVESDSFDNQYDSGAENDPVLVTSEELKTIMTPDENGIISLEKNYLVTDDWAPLTFGTVIINGNNHTISGLTKPLVKTATNITINDLTISNSFISPGIETDNGLGTAAFVSWLDAGTVAAEFNNCHLINSSVTGKNNRASGIVSYFSGFSGSTLKIQNCTVENCVIKSVDGTGGLVAYSKPTTIIANSSVKKTSVTSTEDRLGTKKPIAGGVIGTIQGSTTFTNVTVTDVTVSNNNASESVHNDMIGRIETGGSIN